jgi:hypothetical protein
VSVLKSVAAQLASISTMSGDVEMKRTPERQQGGDSSDGVQEQEVWEGTDFNGTDFSSFSTSLVPRQTSITDLPGIWHELSM